MAKSSVNRFGTTWAVFVLLIVLIVFVFSLTNFSRREEPIAYSVLLEQIDKVKTAPQASSIERITFSNGENIVFVKFAGDAKEKPVVVMTEDKKSLLDKLLDAGITVQIKDVDKSPMWFGMLSSFFLPILVIVGLLFMFRAAQSRRDADAESIAHILKEAESMGSFQARLANLEKEVERLKEKEES